MPEVYNKHHKNAPKEAVYVGRPSKWGNPFTHDPKAYMAYASSKTPLTLCKSREEAVASYRALLLSNRSLCEAAKAELRGKDLVCWCYPAACHAEVLMEVANEEPVVINSGTDRTERMDGGDSKVSDAAAEAGSQ